jgi:hypothetical protein
MATRIIEYGGGDRNDRLELVPNGGVAQPALTAGAVQLSAAFSNGTNMICIQTDEIVHVRTGGTAPVATTNDYKIKAGDWQFFSVRPLDKVSILLGS